MGITVRSPYSGRPVKIRDQDVGRAVRDEENRIFYVLPRSDGSGYYSAITRKGGQRDETRYDQLVAKEEQARDTGAQRSAAQIHDATGKGRGKRGKLVVLFLLLVVLILVILFLPGYGIYGDWAALRGDAETPPPNKIIDPSPRAPRTPPPAEPDTPAPGNATSKVAEPAVKLAADSENQTPVAIPDAILNTPIPPPPPVEPEPDPTITTATGLRDRVIHPGFNEKSPQAQPGQYLSIHYTGYLKNGIEFETTYNDQNNPFEFVLAAGQVIPGLDEGITGMRVGEIRRFIIPSRLAYGNRGHSPRIAPNADLEFEVDLKHIRPGVTIDVTLPGSNTREHAARTGDTLTLHYNAYLPDDTLFDSTHARRRPLTITLGQRKVISGLEAGIIGMTLGENRSITIPPYLAYGDRGVAGIIPPATTLRYVVELVEIDRNGEKIAQ